jgi:hypothetical protein
MTRYEDKPVEEDESDPGSDAEHEGEADDRPERLHEHSVPYWTGVRVAPMG